MTERLLPRLDSKPVRTVYLAGPMRGIPEYNFPAFHEAARVLRARGYRVDNPAERDEARGFDPANDEAQPLAYYMQDDLPAVCRSDAVVVLPGWESSRGATLEVLVARAVDKPVLAYPDLSPVTESCATANTSEAPQGAKGVKEARFDLIPPDALWQLALVFGKGAEKYAARNWERGFDWSKSYGALQRHLALWWAGEDTDDETGLSHMAHAAWHCLVLLSFTLRGVGVDDRAPAAYASMAAAVTNQAEIDSAREPCLCCQGDPCAC